MEASGAQTSTDQEQGTHFPSEAQTIHLGSWGSPLKSGCCSASARSDRLIGLIGRNALACTVQDVSVSDHEGPFWVWYKSIILALTIWLLGP